MTGGVRWLHRLTDIDEVDGAPVPQDVILTEVCMDEVALLVH